MQVKHRCQEFLYVDSPHSGLSLNAKLQEKSLVIVYCLVNYSGVVKVHIMAKLVCVSRNFKIAVANTHSSSMFTKPCGKCSIRLTIICEIAIKAVFFVYYTSRPTTESKLVLNHSGLWAQSFQDLRTNQPCYTLERLYKSLVRPVMGYADVVWDGCTKCECDFLEHVQYGLLKLLPRLLKELVSIALRLNLAGKK